MRAALIAVTIALAAAPNAAQAESYWEARGCDHGHRSSVAYNRVSALMRHHRPVVDRARVRHYATCVATAAKRRAVWRHVRRSWAWRRAYAHRWPIRLNRFPAGWVRWARNITACESTWNRYATNGIHQSYFQWNPNTWAAASAGFDAPASPFDASWPHQAVIAIRWAWKAGTSQWVCRG